MKILLILAGSYAFIVLAAYVLQGKMLYYPYRALEMTPGTVNMEYEDVEFGTKDGNGLHGWYVPSETSRAVVLFCHGNAGNISHRLDSIRMFNELDLDVFIFDYRGYGKSEGRPSEQGTYRDVEAAWEYLTVQKKIPADRIILFGRSLGGGVAAELALHNKPLAFIIESSFTSIPDVGKRYYPWLPVSLLSKYRYETIDKIGSITCPVLVIHSPDDDIIPFEHGKRLFESANPPKEFLEIVGDHNTGFLESGIVYSNGIKTFLEKYAGTL